MLLIVVIIEIFGNDVRKLGSAKVILFLYWSTFNLGSIADFFSKSMQRFYISVAQEMIKTYEQIKII